MAYIFTADEFCKRAKKVATSYKTLYVKGCFGAPMNAKNKIRYSTNTAYNKREDRKKKILAASADTFGFDCVCLIKGLLWGWSGDVNATYGGAVYKSNGVPDFGTEAMLNYCTNVSSKFDAIPKGAVLWRSGHVGIYIGDGLAVECTPSWADCVQITAVKNIEAKADYNAREWTKWGKLEWIDYHKKSDVIAEDGVWGKATTTYTQKYLGTTADGIVSNQPTANKKYLPAVSTNSWKFVLLAGKGSAMVRALQKLIGAGVDGKFGKKSVAKLKAFLASKGYPVSTGTNLNAQDVKSWQKFINKQF